MLNQRTGYLGQVAITTVKFYRNSFSGAMNSAQWENSEPHTLSNYLTPVGEIYWMQERGHALFFISLFLPHPECIIFIALSSGLNPNQS